MENIIKTNIDTLFLLVFGETSEYERNHLANQIISSITIITEHNLTNVSYLRTYTIDFNSNPYIFQFELVGDSLNMNCFITLKSNEYNESGSIKFVIPLS